MDERTARLIDEARASRERGRGERLDSQAFLARELGIEPVREVSEDAASEPRRTVVPGPGGTRTGYNMGGGNRGVAILPSGRIQLPSGKNEYWSKGTGEVWEGGGGGTFVVVTSNGRPYHAIGARADFSHDQTQRRLRTGATMIGWFSIDPNGEQGGNVPTKGSFPVYTYK